MGHRRCPERGTMLIVDDDAINCAILENIFAPYYNTDTAPDGRAGLEAVLEKQDSLCAVLLDVIMPGMDGIQVLHALAERGLLAKIPVFLITAEASGSVMKEAYALGGDGRHQQAGHPLCGAAAGAVGGGTVPRPGAAEQCGGAAAGRPAGPGQKDHRAEQGG